MGPDLIPNEAFIEADNKTRHADTSDHTETNIKRGKNTQTVATRRNH